MKNFFELIKDTFKTDLSNLNQEKIISLNIQSQSPKAIKTLRPGQIRWLTEEQVNAFTQEQREVLDSRQRTELWKQEIAFKRAKTLESNETVSTEEFNALALAQAAINHTQQTLVYGSENQLEHMNADTGRDGKTPVLGRNFSGASLAQKSLEELVKATVGLSPNHMAGLTAGLASHYGAGNCGEHSATAFCYLVKFGYPGLTITRCASLVANHGFVMIEGRDVDGKPFKISCDAWPANDTQAVLWKDHEYYYADGEAGKAYKVMSSFTITPENMGTDLHEEAFSRIDPNILKMIAPAGMTPTLTPTEIERRKQHRRTNETHRDQHTTITRQIKSYSDNAGHGLVADRQDALDAIPLGVEIKESWTTSSTPVLEAPLTAAEIKLNPELDWPAFPKVNLPQKEIETLREKAKEEITQSARKNRGLSTPSLYQKMLHGAKQLMGSSYSELKKLDEMARAAGMSQGIRLEPLSETSTELEPESEVVLISKSKRRAYIRRNRLGELHNHWKIAILDGTQQVKVGDTMKSVNDLRENDLINGKFLDKANQKQRKEDGPEISEAGPPTPTRGRGRQ